jgi:hypothetical protein
VGREVRKIKAGWEHPRDARGNYEPLLPYSRLAGLLEDYEKYPDDFNAAPTEAWVMPNWTEDEATMFVMYEDTTEGAPISPAFATPEELARWLADNQASSFGNMTATYSQWLRVCNGGYAPGMVMVGGTLTSGVAGIS